MKNKLVSVIVPVYEVEKFIEKSLESVCQQSYRRIEIILVDDETKDDSICIAQKVLEKYPAVTYKIITESNKGLPGARNEGVKHAEGDYYCFIDSDDCIGKYHIERMLYVMENNELLVCYSDFESTNEENRLGNAADNDKWEIVDQENLMNDFLIRKRVIHCCSLMLSKEVMENFRFNEKLRFGEDVEFMWKIFSYIKKVGHCFQKSYKYLARENSIMSSYSYEKDRVFIKEFRNTIDCLSVEFPERTALYNQVYYRNIMGWLHQLSRKTSYEEFRLGLALIDKKEMHRILKCFEDNRVKILNTIMHINKWIFYIVLSRF